eukprot:gene17003-20233_t
MSLYPEPSAPYMPTPTAPSPPHLPQPQPTTTCCTAEQYQQQPTTQPQKPTILLSASLLQQLSPLVQQVNANKAAAEQPGVNNKQPSSPLLTGSDIPIQVERDPIRYAEFVLDSKAASDAYSQWRNSLWFTPTGFKKQVGPSLEKTYMPFYAFNVTYQVHFSGAVTYVCTSADTSSSPSKVHVHLPHAADATKKMESGFISRTVNKILLSASNDLRDYEDQKVLIDFNRVKMATRLDFTSHCTFDHVRQGSCVGEKQVWATHRAKVEVQEQDNAAIYLRNQEQTDHVDNVSSRVQVIDISASLYYIPFYSSSYEFDGRTYHFHINAHNGQTFAMRPSIGAGKAGDLYKFVRNYFTTLAGVRESLANKRGTELALADGAEVYDHSHYYLLWPRSDTTLFSSSAVGFVTIKSHSNSPILVRGQKRRGYFKGLPTLLAPHSETTYSYKGHWCVEVLEGDHSLLEITYYSINGGASYPNIGGS